MKRSITVILTAAAVLLAQPIKADAPDRLFVGLTSADPQTQAMAMILTLQTLKRGVAADILLCGPGGDVALADRAATTLKTKMGPRSPQDFLVAAIKAGARARVCAIYLPNAGHAPSDLIDGVGVATPPEIADILVDGNTRPFTF